MQEFRVCVHVRALEHFSGQNWRPSEKGNIGNLDNENGRKPLRHKAFRENRER